MKITIKYEGGRWYGNDYPEKDFTASISKAGEHGGIELDLQFAKPKAGRGVNPDNRGYVKGASLRLTDDEARSLAAAVLWHLDCADRESVALRFGTPPKGG